MFLFSKWISRLNGMLGVWYVFNTILREFVSMNEIEELQDVPFPPFVLATGDPNKMYFPCIDFNTGVSIYSWAGTLKVNPAKRWRWFIVQDLCLSVCQKVFVCVCVCVRAFVCVCVYSDRVGSLVQIQPVIRPWEHTIVLIESMHFATSSQTLQIRCTRDNQHLSCTIWLC